MADLLFGDFALMSGLAIEEKQFKLPDDFSKAYFTFLSSLCDPASGFPAVFGVFKTRMDRCREIASTVVYTNAKQRNSPNFLSQRSKSSLTKRCNVKENISCGLKGFVWLQKGEYLFDFMAKILSNLQSVV